MEFNKYQYIGKLNTEFLEVELVNLQQMNLSLPMNEMSILKKGTTEITIYFINAFTI